MVANAPVRAEQVMRDLAVHNPSGGKDFQIYSVEMENTFGDDNLSNEMKLTYHMLTPSETAKNAYSARIYDGSAVTNECFSKIPVNQQSISISSSYETLAQDQTDVEVTVDIHQDMIIADDMVFSYRDDNIMDIAYVEFCIRNIIFYDWNGDGIDVEDDLEGLTFYDTIFNITIDLRNGFQVTDVDLEVKAPVLKQDEIVLDYELEKYQCDIDGTASENVIDQTENLFICLRTPTPSIGIRRIWQMQFDQPASSVTYECITDGQPNSITTSQILDMSPNKLLVTSTRLIMPFFENAQGGAQKITCTGTVIMMFQNDEAEEARVAQRKLAGLNTKRYLQKEGATQEEHFEVDVGILKKVDSAASQTASVFAVVTMFMISYIALL